MLCTLEIGSKYILMKIAVTLIISFSLGSYGTKLALCKYGLIEAESKMLILKCYFCGNTYLKC